MMKKPTRSFTAQCLWNLPVTGLGLFFLLAPPAVEAPRHFAPCGLHVPRVNLWLRQCQLRAPQHLTWASSTCSPPLRCPPVRGAGRVPHLSCPIEYGDSISATSDLAVAGASPARVFPSLHAITQAPPVPREERSDARGKPLFGESPMDHVRSIRYSLSAAHNGPRRIRKP